MREGDKAAPGHRCSSFINMSYNNTFMLFTIGIVLHGWQSGTRKLCVCVCVHACVCVEEER